MHTSLALLLCVMSVSGYAQSPGTFTATGNMTTARFGHNATLLEATLDWTGLINNGQLPTSLAGVRMVRALGIRSHELRVCIAEGRIGSALLARFREPRIAADDTN